MRRSLSRIVEIILITLALGGCTTTTPIVSEWRNPAYASGSFKRIMSAVWVEKPALGVTLKTSF